MFADPQGRFQFSGVVPGEYRAVAGPLLSTRPEDIDAVTQLTALAETIAETIKVERGGTSTVSLSLTAPYL